MAPFWYFLNSAFKCSTKLSTSLPRINHYKGFRFILQSPTSMFIVLGWTLSPPQELGFLHRGYMKHEWQVSDWSREGHLGTRQGLKYAIYNKNIVFLCINYLRPIQWICLRVTMFFCSKSLFIKVTSDNCHKWYFERVISQNMKLPIII